MEKPTTTEGAQAFTDSVLAELREVSMSAVKKLVSAGCPVDKAVQTVAMTLVGEAYMLTRAPGAVGLPPMDWGELVAQAVAEVAQAVDMSGDVN